MHSSQAALFGHKLQYVAWDSDTISPTFKKGLSEAVLPLWKVANLQWIQKFVRHSEIVLDTAIEKFAESGLDPNSWWYIYIYVCTYIMFVNLNIHRYQISMIFLHLNQCLTSQDSCIKYIKYNSRKRVESTWIYRGHYISKPNNALFKGNPSKLPYICCLFDSPQMGGI